MKFDDLLQLYSHQSLKLSLGRPINALPLPNALNKTFDKLPEMGT